MLWDLSGDVSDGPESLSGAAYRCWFEGQSVEEISQASQLQAEIIIGGNGLMDSFVDYVYEPPVGIGHEFLADTQATDTDMDTPIVSADEGLVIDIGWSWGAQESLVFDPGTDTLNFGWIGASAFELSEEGGSVVISLPSNNQTYTLEEVSAADLSMSNIQALDQAVLDEWSTFLG